MMTGRGYKKATDEAVTAAYVWFGTLDKAADALGMCPQSVHERLNRLGKMNKRNNLSDADREKLARVYPGHADAGTLKTLAHEMGRTIQFLCRQAKLLGLTDPARAKPYLAPGMSERATEWHANHEHPRGMLGKIHTKATKDLMAGSKIAAMQKRAIAGTLYPERPTASWKAGWREFGGIRKYYRSKWEANYGRYLEWLRSIGEISAWEHEPETFWFDAIKRGTRSYLPDFRVTEKNGAVCYHEVKGWMDERSATKLKRMKKYYPSVRLILIEKKQYAAIAKSVSSMIEGWE